MLPKAGVRRRAGANLGAEAALEVAVGDEPLAHEGLQLRGRAFRSVAFGRVTRGMDVVHKVHDSLSNKGRLIADIRIEKSGLVA